MIRAEIDWLYPTMHLKNPVLGNIFRGTSSDSFRQNLSLHPYCQDILQSTSCHIRDFLPSYCGGLLTCGLKSVYPTINLPFLGIIVKVKLPAKFFLYNFEWFYLQMNSYAKSFFLSCPKHCDRGLTAFIV